MRLEQRIEDVTTHPVTGPGIDWNARIYDAQKYDASIDFTSGVILTRFGKTENLRKLAASGYRVQSIAGSDPLVWN